MPKVFIATPMYGGQCFGFYTQGMLALQEIFVKHNIISNLKLFNLPLLESQYSCMYNESLIPRARNAMTRAFLKSDCTHLFFIDADIKFNASDVPPMIAADKDIICGIYPKKEINWEMVHRAALGGIPPDQLKDYTGSWVVDLVGYKNNATVPMNEPLEIYNGGTGFMLIKREVFEKLIPHTESYLNDVRDLSGTIEQQEEIYKFFDTPIDANRRLLSEDYALCANWRKLGGKVWAAPWVTLGHAGMYLYEGKLAAAPAQQKPAETLPEAAD